MKDIILRALTTKEWLPSSLLKIPTQVHSQQSIYEIYLSTVIFTLSFCLNTSATHCQQLKSYKRGSEIKENGGRTVEIGAIWKNGRM